MRPRRPKLLSVECEPLRERGGLTFWRCPTDDAAELYQVAVFDGEAPAGGARVEKAVPRGMKVGIIRVVPGYQRRGIGTKIYEEVAQSACAEGQPFVSDTQRSRYAEAFWRKQERKGRARCVDPRPGTVFNPEAGAGDPKLPEPARGKWPCRRYLIDCPVESLEGTRRRKR